MHPDDVCDGSDEWGAPDGDDGKVECGYCGRRVGFNPRGRPQRGGRRKLARHGHQNQGMYADDYEDDDPSAIGSASRA